MRNWIKAKLIHNPEFHNLHSNARNIKPLLLAIPGHKEPAVGWYFGGIIHEWQMTGSVSEQRPTHFMEMPKLPK